VFQQLEISSSAEGGLRARATSSGVVGLQIAVLTLAVAFFFDFPAADLGAAGDFISGFLGLAVFLVAVTLGSVTGGGEG
jgi:hypothetical protein